MARSLKSDRQIDHFIAKVIDEAQHHAGLVEQIIQPLSDKVRARLRLNAGDDVSVYERNGKLARTCWVTIGGQRWVFSYNYLAGKIDLREGSTRGRLHFQFDNDTTPADLKRVVASL